MILKRALQFFWRKMLRSFLTKIFPTLAALIALSGITSTTLCCKKARGKIRQLLVFLFFVEKIFSSYIFHTKKFSVLAGSWRDIGD